MSEYYYRHFYTMAVGFAIGAFDYIICIYTADYSDLGGADESGRLWGIDVIGIHSAISFVAIHHIIIFLLMNNWDFGFICFTIFGLAWTPLTLVLNNMVTASRNYMAIFGIFLRLPLFWIWTLFTIGLAVIPFYAWLKYR